MGLVERTCLIGLVITMTMLSQNLLAQITAAFSASSNSGCPPLVVSYTNQSTATGGISLTYEWDDGVNFSTLTNPVLGYTTPGTYVITLTAIDVNNASVFDTETMVITVYDKPDVQFSFTPSSGCAPLSVSFNSNSSSAGSGTIVSRAWDFGDGTTGSGISPSHNYVSSGTYTPSLTIINSFGCQKTHTSNTSVSVSGGPNASFTSTTNQACGPPLTVNFTSTTNGGQTPYTYSWDLDVSNASAANPSATYNSAGSYDIQLAVEDASGCTDTLNSNSYVVIHEITPSFTVESPACVDEPIVLNNTTTGAVQYHWNWGDNSSSAGPNPSKSYSSGGTYTITLTASAGNCSETHVETVQVQEINASFTVSPDYFCEPPYTSYYTNTSTVNFGTLNHTHWIWGIFDVGFNDTILSESSINGVDTIERDEDDLGYFDDTLIVATAEGCTAQVEVLNSVLIEDQIVDFTPFPEDGCVPILVDFQDNSIPANSHQINSWSWDFGNGQTSNLQNPQNILFTDTGCYQPKLVIQNTYGCRDSLQLGEENAICYGQPPTAMADFTVDSICASDTMALYNVPLDSFANEWIWNFSDGTHAYGDTTSTGFVDTGWINLQYVVGHYGCYDTIDYDSVVYVLGPLSKFAPELDCSLPFERQLHQTTSKGVERFIWNFGDGSPLDSTNASPLHTYAQTGTYVITLNTYNDTYGCEMSSSFPVNIYDLQADFTISNFGQVPVDSFSCFIGAFHFDGSISEDHVNTYIWFIEGDTINEGSPLYHEFAGSGKERVVLQVSDANGCIKLDTQYVFISDPTAEFDFQYTGGCDPVNIQFLDESVSDTNVVRWDWYYGFGTVDTNEFNPIKTFHAAGDYSVFVTITDAVGCTDVVSKTLEIRFPYVGFLMDSVVCQNSLITVMNQSIGDSLTYFWNFKNGNTSTQENPGTQLYTGTGTKSVFLAIEDSLGCKDTAFHELLVAPLPKANFTSDTANSPCLPLFVNFIDSSDAEDIAFYSWDFGDGTGSVQLQDSLAFHTYNKSGNFNVSLTVETIYGCTSTITKNKFIQVSGPYAEFAIAPDSTCIGSEVKFFVTERSALGSYTWIYGDGFDTTVAGIVDTVSHAFDRIGTRVPIVVYTDSSSVCQIPYFDSIYIYEVESKFGFVPDSVGCGKLNAKLINEGIGANNWRWDINGEVTATKNPLKYFNRPGEYEVELYVESREFGCKDSLTKLFVVYATPDVTASADTLICLGDSTEVWAETESDSVSWYWTPARFASFDSADRTVVTPDKSVFMVGHALDTNGCVGADSVRVIVQDTPQVTLFEDTVVVVGELVVLNPKTDDEITYEWRPPGFLSCNTCPYPIYRAEAGKDFSLVARDVYGCFEKEFFFRIDIDEKYSLDVPDAFSPNGDGVNDVIYARGWGVKEVMEFKIYNRWGHEVFSTNSLHIGWDGEYRGKPQSMDTYAYVVKALKYDGEEIFKEGFIELIR